MHRRILIGAVAFAIVSVLSPSEFRSWMFNTTIGIVLSTLFLMPLAKVLTGEKLLKASLISFVIGVVVFILYMHYFLKDDVVKAVIFLCEWLATFAFISVIFQLIFSEVREELDELLRH